MVDESLNRWMHSRLSLAERINLQRRDEEADSYALAPGAKSGRCVCCNVRLTDSDQFDPLRRCKTCRDRRRLERRKWRSRG